MHLHQAFPPAKAWWFDFPKYGSSLSKMAVTYSRGTMSFCVIREEYEGHGRKFFEKVKLKPEIMLGILEKVNAAAEKIFSFEKKWRNVDFAKVSDKELLKYQRELFRWDEILWRKGQIQNLLEMHNNYLSAYIRELIRKTFGKKYEAEYFQILSAGEYKSRAERQDEDFAELVKRIKKVKNVSKKFDDLLNRHTEKYAWMLYGWTGPALDIEYFRGNILAAIKNQKLIAEIGKIKSEHKSNKKRRKELIGKFSDSDKKSAYLLKKLLEAKAKRVDAHSLTYFFGDKIYTEIGRRKFLSISQLRAAPPEEIPQIFKKPDPHRLNDEYEYVMYWYENGKVKKLTGKNGRKKFQYIADRLPKVKPTNVIKGEMAYMGKAKGMARVILSKDDFGKFEKGEILVTRMTDPSYVPLMKISKAIITDIGGITCHAAIVSRELKKPCVIGTKIGTKVLKDGDLAEVDADRGIVRVIKKA
ncbi:MAG: PEP-utilizing enzyme [Patescibacteria group bacterium]|nr:PEP-utilizing enzyme [Patescibacteria group bacterium]